MQTLAAHSRGTSIVSRRERSARQRQRSAPIAFLYMPVPPSTATSPGECSTSTAFNKPRPYPSRPWQRLAPAAFRSPVRINAWTVFRALGGSQQEPQHWVSAENKPFSASHHNQPNIGPSDVRTRNSDNQWVMCLGAELVVGLPEPPAPFCSCSVTV